MKRGKLSLRIISVVLLLFLLLALGPSLIPALRTSWQGEYNKELLKLWFLKSSQGKKQSIFQPSVNYTQAYLEFLSNELQKLEPALLNPEYLEQQNYLIGGKVRVIVMFEGNPSKISPSQTELNLINGAAASLDYEELVALNRTRGVKKVFLDRRVQLEPVAKAAYGGLPSDNRNEQINVEPVWAQGYDGRGVVIAILDTGVDDTHPDLLGRVIAQRSFVAGETYEDGHGHGTHCASIAAGTGLASDGAYKGVAPNAWIMNVKVLDKEGNGYFSDIIAGMQWAIANGADIISMSLGGRPLSGINHPLTVASDNAMKQGVFVVAAAGNSGV